MSGETPGMAERLLAGQDGWDAAHAGKKASANPHAPDSKAYYRWHQQWHRAGAEMARAARDHKLADKYSELATLYGRMADDAGVL